MALTDTPTPIQFLEEADEHGLRLVNAANTMPCQVAPIMWPDQRSPLAHCLRVYVDGKSIGVVGQATVTSEWTAMRADRCDVHRYATRAEAIRYVTGQTVHRYKEPKIVANEPKEATMTTKTAVKAAKATPKAKVPAYLDAGTILEAHYKGVTHLLLVLADEGGYSLHCEHGDCVAAPIFRSLSTAGKHVTGRVSCEGPRFWTVGEAAPTEVPPISVPVEAEIEPTSVACAEAAVDVDLAAAHEEAARKERNRKKNAARASKAAATRIAKVAGGE